MVTIGLVGLGGMGTVHYNNYRHILNVQVVAAVGVGAADQLKAMEWGIPLFASITDMLHAHEITLVDICTPTFLHKQQVMESLELGKHTLIEKPIALSYRDATEMYSKAQERGVQLYVAQVLQFSREIEVLHQVVASCEYGKVLDGCFERLTARPQWSQGSWLFDKKKSGLLPYDLHIHDLDVIVSLFGEPKEIRFTSCGRPNSPFQEQYRFSYGFEEMNISAEAAWFNAAIPFTARWRVYFQEGMLWYDGETVTGYKIGKEPKVYDTTEETKIPTGINIPPTGWFLNELRHFVHCAENGIPSKRVSKEQVLSVMRVLEKVIK